MLFKPGKRTLTVARGVRSRVLSRFDEPAVVSQGSHGPIRAGLRTPIDATTGYAQNVAHIGRRNSAGRYYAACSDDFGEDICGCPVCRRAARDAAV